MVKLSNNKQRGILRKLRMTIQCVNIVNSIAYKNHSPLVILRNEGSHSKQLCGIPRKLGMKAFKTTFLSMKTKITYGY